MVGSRMGMISVVRRPMECGVHRFEGTVLTCESGLGTGSESWSVDVPTVLWMLERVAEGEVDAEVARDQLRQATSWDSGCCRACDRASNHYDDARSWHEEAVHQWQDQQARFDTEEYPYILTNAKIHARECHHPGRPTPPRFPETLHEFALLFELCGESLDRVFDELEHAASGGAQWLSGLEVQARLARDGVRAVKARLCRTCKPSLPELDPETHLSQPVCWAWPADPTTVERLRAQAVSSPRPDVLPDQGRAFAMLEHWHSGRCAVCGGAPSGGLVRDHDHASGMMRGLLCQACNIAEARSASALFSNYRRRPPAAILAVEVLYLPTGFKPGVGHLPQYMSKGRSDDPVEDPGVALPEAQLGR